MIPLLLRRYDDRILYFSIKRSSEGLENFRSLYIIVNVTLLYNDKWYSTFDIYFKIRFIIKMFHFSTCISKIIL